MKLDYVRMTTKYDKDVPYLLSVYQLPEVSRFISIDENNYFTYVSESPNVYFYKIYLGEVLVAAMHIECFNKTLYMDIVVIPQYQHKGIGTQIIKDIQSDVLPIRFDRIEISIDESNIFSKKLFEKMGFVIVSKEDELENYIYVKKTWLWEFKSLL